MNINFNQDDAIKYGVDEAIVIAHIRYWMKYSEANKKNYHDGRYWVFGSIRGMEEFYGFWSRRQLERILKSLISQGVIMTGNFNKAGYDRTTWYTIIEDCQNETNISPNEQETAAYNAMVAETVGVEALQDAMKHPGKLIPTPKPAETNNPPNGEMHSTKRGNGSHHSVTTIQIDKKDNKNTSGKFTPPTLEEVTSYCINRGNNVDPEAFIAFYESNGWKVGRNPMKSWQSAIITWEKRQADNKPKSEAYGYDYS